MKKIILTAVLLFFCCLGVNTANAQIKLGGKNINVEKLSQAGGNVLSAVTLTDADIAKISGEYMEWMDANNPVAKEDSEHGARLKKITENIRGEDGMKLNFKVYEVEDINAFACGDGSIRVFAGLMKIMTDDEIMAIIGHEIGHVKNTDVKDAMKNAYLTSAVKNAAGAAGGVVGKLSNSELGTLAQNLSNAQFSQKQENAADDYAFEFCIKNKVNPYAMSNSLKKLEELSNAGGEKASKVAQMFSTHPDSGKRAERMKAKADAYTGKQ